MLVMNQSGDSEKAPRVGDGLDSWEQAAWRRLTAGMLVEQGLGDKEAAKRWQALVRSGDFDPDRCAAELLDAGPTKPAEVEAKLLLRSARLERDLLMTPLMQGVAGASRKARGAARTGAAALVTQLIVVGIYSVLVFLFLLVLAFKGVQFDPFFQSLLDLIPALPESTP